MSSRGADQHACSTAQAPIDLAGQQFPGLLQSAARIQKAINAFAHFPVEVRNATVADVWGF